MEILQLAGGGVCVLVLIILAFKIFFKPIRIIAKFLLNTLLGFLALAVINYLGGYIGISIGVNWTSAAIVGVLGMPGVALLLILQWLMAL